MGRIEIPADVIDYVRTAFADCNQRTSEKMTRIPTTHETSLDLTLIEALSQYSAPYKTKSNWTIRMDVHYLGGGRHFGEWEIADIGFILVFRRAGKVRQRKVALLQSKRLYPQEQGLVEDTPIDYMVGFGRLMEGDVELPAMESRTFTFTEESEYHALAVGDRQYGLIEEYEAEHAIPVHYLLYHPLVLPWSQVIPIQGTRRVPAMKVGAQVKRSRDVRTALAGHAAGSSPKYTKLAQIGGWKLESFVADELLGCREGYVAKDVGDLGLRAVFNRRSGPIAAAISITIDEG